MWKMFLQVAAAHIPSPYHPPIGLCFLYLKKINLLCAFLSSLWFFLPFLPFLSPLKRRRVGEAGICDLLWNQTSNGVRLFSMNLAYWPIGTDKSNGMGRLLDKDHRFFWKKHYSGYQLTALEYLWFILYLANKKGSYFTWEFSQNLVKW